MINKATSRRRFLVAALTVSGLATGSLASSLLREAAAWAETGNAALLKMARLLFPHDSVPDQIYAEVVAGALAATASDPAAQGLLTAAESELDARSQSGSWYDSDEQEQLTALTAVQGETFFAAIMGLVMFFFATITGLVMFGLYTHPALWQHIGYPGSSKEYGGYLERGFDDIDWLPEAGS